ncbi:MAG: hypothetical protein WEC59_06185 [Salibacteraceae bacterium]
MLRFWLTYFLVMGGLVLQAQKLGEWKQKRIIDVESIDVRIDQLNNVYALERAQIEKFDSDGKLLTRYSNKLIGEDIQVDVSNPMKVLVFSPNQMRLVFLDSRLGELRDEANLFRLGFQQISLAATSHSNGFWLYDPINFKLIRFDQHFKKERESMNLAQILRLEFYPTDLKELDNRVYLTDPSHGVFVFDIYGNYLKRIPIKGIVQLKLTNDYMFFQKASVLFALNLRDQSENRVQLTADFAQPFDVNRSLIALNMGKEIIIYAPKP